MANATINVVASVAGQTVPVQLSRSEDGTGLWTPSVTAGQTPTGWTKTDDTDGVAAMAGGHGLETGDRIDVFWNGGRHYNMTATVAGNNVTLAGGGGDALPASATAVVVAKHEVVDAAFDPDNMTVLLISTDRLRVGRLRGCRQQRAPGPGPARGGLLPLVDQLRDQPPHVGQPRGGDLGCQRRDRGSGERDGGCALRLHTRGIRTAAHENLRRQFRPNLGDHR